MGENYVWAAGLAVVSTVLAIALGCGACAPRSMSGEPVTAVGSTETSPRSTSSTLSGSPAGAESGGAEVFVALAAAVAPVPAFGLAELPAESTVAAEWWPVLEGEPAAPVEGATVANPWVSKVEGVDREAQLLLDCGGGWLVIIVNFRGDLGDVVGEEVGAVGGNRALLYEVNGGNLVQWSHEGRWYGVFGRGVSKEVVVETALNMELVRLGEDR